MGAYLGEIAHGDKHVDISTDKTCESSMKTDAPVTTL